MTVVVMARRDIPMSVRLAIAEADVSTLNVKEFCRLNGISRDRFYAIRRRFALEGEAGLEPRSRAPKQVANRTSVEVEDVIVTLRKELDDLGVDSGAATIWAHLGGRLEPGQACPSEATIWRVLRRRGFIVPDPSKAPRRTPRSFAAERANECWQIDDTSWFLADGREVKIIHVIDDCTRLCVASRAVVTCTGTAALETVAAAAAEWNLPQRILSDNAQAFRHVLADAVAELGITTGHSRPYHPQTCGKVERFHQTVKGHLRTRRPARTLPQLQRQLDWFRDYYNHQRPHRSLNRARPAQVWNDTPKSGPKNHPITATTRVSTNTVANGTIQIGTRLAIAVGAAHNSRRATTVITGQAAHVFIDGQLIRDLTIDPTRRRQPLYNRPGRPTT
jgi:transposase InsO family protein